MKHSQTLEKADKHFLNCDASVVICEKFTNALMGNKSFVSFPKGTKAKYSFSCNDPKKKGYRKVKKDRSLLFLDEQVFTLCRQEVRFFRYLGIKTQGCFWMKVEMIKH